MKSNTLLDFLQVCKFVFVITNPAALSVPFVTSQQVMNLQLPTSDGPLWMEKLRYASLLLIHTLSPSLRNDGPPSRLLAASPGGGR